MLIEREVPLQSLENIASRISQDGGTIVLVSGEAGIGKTTFLQAFAESISQEFLVRWGGCDPLSTPRVLGPLHDMSGQMGSSVRAALDQGTDFSKLTSCLLDELQSSIKPGVMIVEDAHWADNATLDLLKCIGRRISFLNTLLIISYRSDEVARTDPLLQTIGDFPQAKLQRLALKSISSTGVEMLAIAAGRTAKGLHAATAGNPFYVTEYLADDAEGQSGAPESVQHAVSSRINRLDTKYQNFLETISVIPHTIQADLLDALFEPDGAELSNYCMERNFLKPDQHGSFRFRHELARLGTLARVPAHRLKEIHTTIFRLMETAELQTTLEQKLYHAIGAELANEVLELAQQAGKNAATTGSHAEAAAHYAKALEHVDKTTDEVAATLYECWSYEAALIAIDDDTINARHQALALWRKLGRIDKIGENLRWLSRQHWYRGESELANQYINEAISTLENTDPSVEQAMAYSLGSQYHMLNDRMEEAITFGLKALEIEAEFPSAEVRIHALTNIGTAKLNRNDRSGLDHMAESLELALQHGFHEHAARVYTNTASGTVLGLDYEVAEKAISDGIVFDTNHDLDSWTHYLIGLMAQLKMEQCQFEEAETIAKGVMEMQDQTLLMKLPALLVLSKVSLRLGRSNAQQLLQAALDDANSVAEPQYVCPARYGLIEAAWHEGDDDAARHHIEELLPVNNIPLSAWSGAECGIWMHRYGFSLENKTADCLPEPYQLEIDGKHQLACDAWMAKGNHYRGALCLLHAKDGDATARFTHALQLLEGCQATASIKKLRQMANEQGILDALPIVKRGPRKEARKHPLGLTARQQEILPLIVQGKSNREISETLSRSQRTVENHVASILKKMNVKNRMEAMLRGKNEPWLITHSEQE